MSADTMSSLSEPGTLLYSASPFGSATRLHTGLAFAGAADADPAPPMRRAAAARRASWVFMVPPEQASVGGFAARARISCPGVGRITRLGRLPPYRRWETF